MWATGIKTAFLVYLCTGISLCHRVNDDAIQKLKNEIDQMKGDFAFVPNILDALRTSIDDQLDKLRNQGQTTKSPDELTLEKKNARIVAEAITRLNKLQDNVARIEDYVKDENSTDEYLRALDGGSSGQVFEGVLGTVRNLADEMRKELQTDLDPVDTELGKVFQTANERNVVVGGILYMGRVGSACAGDYDTCRTPGSECRDGLCQCVAGLSSDALHQACLEVCPNGYGQTYQTVNNYAIRGYNRVTLQNTTLQTCKARCASESGFICRSFDYFPDWNTCFLSDVVKGDVISSSESNAGNANPDKAQPEEYGEYGNYGDKEDDDDKVAEEVVVTEKPDGWEFNSASIYFQRDCVVNKN